MSGRRFRKEKWADKLKSAFKEYANVLIVGVDNVGSSQMQQVRIALRGKAILVMGKNELMRKVMRDLIDFEKLTHLEALLPTVVGNMGFVFTNSSLREVRTLILSNKVPAAAKCDAVAPVDVFIPAGPTGLNPHQTGGFAPLNIATKIMRGVIEISREVHLVRKGEKVTRAQADMMEKMKMRPFFTAFTVTDMYEHGLYGWCRVPADIVDLDQNALLSKFFGGVKCLAAISLAIGYPTAASVSHSINNAYKNILAIALQTEIFFPEVDKFRHYLQDPDAVVPAASAATLAASGAATEAVDSAKEGDQASPFVGATSRS